jgi:formate dehydrogenase subunit delta
MQHDDVHEHLPHQNSGLEKLIRMANQIATFFLSQPEGVRVEGVSTHINKFWEPRMRRHLFAHLDGGGAGLLPLVVEASKLIHRPEPQAAMGRGVREDTAGRALRGEGPGEEETPF